MLMRADSEHFRHTPWVDDGQLDRYGSGLGAVGVGGSVAGEDAHDRCDSLQSVAKLHGEGGRRGLVLFRLSMTVRPIDVAEQARNMERLAAQS
ncbi:hypothetical protein GCM10010377_70510 [Streptomyces viridiviolaceus]|nr:hypothetical protein GCM10010377_70510 [Streptomyces viridiviolaceus]